MGILEVLPMSLGKLLLYSLRGYLLVKNKDVITSCEYRGMGYLKYLAIQESYCLL